MGVALDTLAGQEADNPSVGLVYAVLALGADRDDLTVQ
jgi:hypothetical protein